ncbi:MAG: hypothetical protein JRF27_05280 [Deltaproteobacteria bacterium]|nr:hypothetical protein [Deltaproteobacteria bacterium]
MATELILTEQNPYTELTLMQKRYVEARLQGLNKTASARAAGSEIPGRASQALEKSPKVRAAIRYLIRESTLNVAELTKSDVLTGMMDAVEAAATAGELVMAWREIGKLLGAYEPERKILEIHDYSQEELKSLSDKDLLNLAGGKMQDVVDAEFTEVDS